MQNRNNKTGMFAKFKGRYQEPNYSRTSDLMTSVVKICTLVALCNVSLASRLAIKLVELLPENSLGTVPPGALGYLPGLKPTDPAKQGFTNPGSFVYVRMQNPVDTQEHLLYFFRSEPTANYPHKNGMRFFAGASFNSSRSKPLYSSHNGFMVIDGTIGSHTRNHVYLLPIYSASTDSFVAPQLAVSTWYMLGENSDVENLGIIEGMYYFATIGPLADSFVQVNMRGIYNFTQPFTDVDFMDFVPPTNPKLLPEIDSLFKIGDWVLMIEKAGLIYLLDYTQNMLEKIQVAQPFGPKFYKLDSSKPCTFDNCELFVTDFRADQNYHLSKLRINMTATPRTAVVYTSLDITSIGSPSRPVQFGNKPVVAVAGSSRFFFYKQVGDGLVPFPEVLVASPTYSGMVPGSLVVGEFDPVKYPDSYPMMAMFIKDGNVNTQEARMYVLSGSCLTNSTDPCSSCIEGRFMDSQGER